VEWGIASATFVGVGLACLGIAYMDALAPYRIVLLLAGVLFGTLGLLLPIVATASRAFFLVGEYRRRVRAEREGLAENERATAEREALHAAALLAFEEAFRGWPEFLEPTVTMTLVISLEEDRRKGHERRGPGWTEFVRAAAAARAAAESIWEPWRAKAIAAMTPLAELRDPIDFGAARVLMESLEDFLHCDIDRISYLRSLASAAGIGLGEFARRLREPFESETALP
jgi:hypothetical protein